MEELDEIKQDIEKIKNNQSTIKEEYNNQSSSLTQEQNNVLIEKLTDPENAVKLKLSSQIGKDLDTIDGSEKLKKTSDTIIDNTLKTEETKAEAKKAKVEKSANQVYFETHIDELKTGGIRQSTYMTRMEKVVKTNDLWFNVIYFIFLWWVIGINTLNNGISKLHWFFCVIIWIFAGVFCIPFIPFAISIGIIRTIFYLIYLFMLKPIIEYFKIPKQKKILKNDDKIEISEPISEINNIINNETI